jgi:hypothetical protein
MITQADNHQNVVGLVYIAAFAPDEGEMITLPAWKNKPSWYQISSSDRMLASETEKMMSDRLGAKKVITLNVSHESLASRPDEVMALIDEAANATQS